VIYYQAHKSLPQDPVLCQINPLKVELSLCVTNKHYAIETYKGVDVYIHILISLLVGEWSTSRSGHYTLDENGSGTPWIGGWTCPEPVRMMWNEEKTCPDQDAYSSPSVVQPVAGRCTDCAVPAPTLLQYTSYLLI
jgi:hypothetical protein